MKFWIVVPPQASNNLRDLEEKTLLLHLKGPSANTGLETMSIIHPEMLRVSYQYINVQYNTDNIMRH